MSSLKIKHLIFILILVFVCCDLTRDCNPFGPNGDDDENAVELAFNVKITYHRFPPFNSDDYYDDNVNVSVYTSQSAGNWQSIQYEKMTRITEQKFEYVAQSIPYETKMWMYSQDWGRSSAGGPEFNGLLFEILGKKLTEEEGFIRKNPLGNPWNVAAFIIKKNNTVVPW